MKLKYGAQRLLAEKCAVSIRLVYDACHYSNDTVKQELVRQKAHELGLVKKF